MAEPNRSDDLHTLRNLIEEASLVVTSIDLPQGRGKRATELLASALALCEDLIAAPPAASIGRLGGLKTAERGPEYYRGIAAKRTTRAGGRPKVSK